MARRRERWLQLEVPMEPVWFRWPHCSPWFCDGPFRRTTRMVEARGYDILTHGTVRDTQPEGPVMFPHNCVPERVYWMEGDDARWRAVVCGVTP